MKNYLAITICAVSILSCSGYLRAQDPHAGLVNRSKLEYQGLRNCNMCHGGRGKDNPLGEVINYQVKLDESVLWATKDKHILAGNPLIPKATN